MMITRSALISAFQVSWHKVNELGQHMDACKMQRWKHLQEMLKHVVQQLKPNHPNPLLGGHGVRIGKWHGKAIRISLLMEWSPWLAASTLRDMIYIPCQYGD
jgi:hypothetical protein